MAHHPPHIYLDDTWYFVTSATLYNRRYLATKGQNWLDDCWARYPVIDFLERDDFDLSV